MNVDLSRRHCLRRGAAWSCWMMGEVEDGLVWDMVQVLTLFCARRYGRRSARNRARKALEAAGHG